MRAILKINDYRPTIVDIEGFSQMLFEDIISDWHDSYEEDYELENGLTVRVESETYGRDKKLIAISIWDERADFSPHDYSGLEMRVSATLKDLLEAHNEEQEEAYQDELEHHNDLLTSYC